MRRWALTFSFSFETRHLYWHCFSPWQRQPFVHRSSVSPGQTPRVSADDRLPHLGGAQGRHLLCQRPPSVWRVQQHAGHSSRFHQQGKQLTKTSFKTTFTLTVALPLIIKIEFTRLRKIFDPSTFKSFFFTPFVFRIISSQLSSSSRAFSTMTCDSQSVKT